MIDFFKKIIKDSAVEYLKQNDAKDNTVEKKVYSTANMGAKFICELYEQALIDVREENNLIVYKIKVKPYTNFIFVEDSKNKYNPKFKVITDGLCSNIFWQRYNQWEEPRELNDFDKDSDFYQYIYNEIEKNDNTFIKRLNKALDNNYGK